MLRCLPTFRARAARAMSTTPSLVQIEKKDNYAIVRLSRAPVNSLNMELLQAIDEAVQSLEQDKNIKGMILSSTNPKIFSAGLDITEMYQPKTKRLREFWRAFQNTYLRLYTTPLATVAAIEGHSPAGGCLLAMCCDSRVMSLGGPLIGLNETKLGIVAPFWMRDVMVNTIGHRETEKMLGLGLQVNALRGKEIGLIDEAVPVEQVHSVAEKLLLEWLSIPSSARKLTKAMMRDETAQKLRSRLDEDRSNFVDFCETDKVQSALAGYLAALKKKAEAKAAK
ncbi:3,2-trans-enoyl-CoA isomerase, mitochondrial precursor [Achlya hypogyna]|uniref:Enoyl-CoA delta isomerase 1, mitochondrial n=1 Tax=Achlya hypogyna TaxID=1202772 RepID=A0A1V9Z572_ACHHY|nr:3,2-trans-enoyl-CoA isomerase, mitochondrial precursor [Achlya hypogyna]